MPQRRATILGDFESQQIGHDKQYFIDRGTFLDCRGTVKIGGASMWGYCVIVLTGSHEPAHRGKVVYKSVVVEDDAWICSNAMLYNCHIGEGAIVAAGAVVRSRDVPPWTMVEGNPGRIIATFDGNEWNYLKGAKGLTRHSEK